ncbi:MAG TPA: aminotransferase class I/II-fold pyridoxal phosphate-dependent enzyme [Thermoanaerobaculia bacterium]|jgi:aspartate aminotransferase
MSGIATARQLALRPQPSASGGIMAISADCRRRVALGETIIDLSLGEPDWNTAEHIGRAAMRAIEERRTRYTPPAGLAQLRQAFIRALTAAGMRYAPREVMVTHGATGALTCAFHALLQPGDEVLIPTPYYPPYIGAIHLTGARVVTIDTTMADGFRLDTERLRDSITPRTKLLILNTPSNPAGVVYTRAELERIAEVVLDTGLAVISDEVYAAFSAPGSFVSIAAIDGELARRTLIVRSVSKTYAMTGWRVGFAAGPASWIEPMTAVQEFLFVTPSSIAQWAALEALSGSQDAVAILANELSSRRTLATEHLRAIDGVQMVATDAGMFLFPDLSGRVADVDAFCARLLREDGVAVVPGSLFGVPSCIRISLAASSADLVRGLERLARRVESEGSWISG